MHVTFTEILRKVPRLRLYQKQVQLVLSNECFIELKVGNSNATALMVEQNTWHIIAKGQSLLCHRTVLCVASSASYIGETFKKVVENCRPVLNLHMKCLLEQAAPTDISCWYDVSSDGSGIKDMLKVLRQSETDIPDTSQTCLSLLNRHAYESSYVRHSWSTCPTFC